MAVTVTIPNAFAAQSGNVPASQIDANFTALKNALASYPTFANYAVDAGAANAYAITLAPVPASQPALTGVGITFKITNSNTAASTLNINGLGNVAIVNQAGAALAGGELIVNRVALVVYDGTNYQLVASAASSTAPTRQVFLSGSGTYNRPAGCRAINIRLVGAGGPGSGNGASGAGTNGADTTFSTLTGGGGKAASSTTCGAGGTAAGGDINIPGAAGGGATLLTTASNFGAGGMGGSGYFGGGGSGGNGNANGGNAPINSGAGGGGGGSASGGNSGTGGGYGGYVEKLISAPAASYSYSVGAGNTGSVGSASTGGTSAAGIIIVDEYYA